MRTTAIIVLAALTLSPAAPSSATSEPIPVRGTGCDVTWTQDPNDPTQAVGYVSGQIAVADPAGPSGYPATVTLTCSVQSGVYTHSAPDDHTANGTGTNAAFVVPESFSVPMPGGLDTVGVCGRVDITDANGTHTYWSNSQNDMWYQHDAGTCTGAPQCLALGAECSWEIAFREWLIDRAVTATQLADGALCPVLAAQAPGVPPVVITPDGDVYVAGEWFWDCPPYGS